MAITESRAYFFVGMAERFWREAESPDRHDMQAVFHALVTQDEAAMRAALAAFGITDVPEFREQDDVAHRTPNDSAE